jgi:hypothetical protein
MDLKESCAQKNVQWRTDFCAYEERVGLKGPRLNPLHSIGGQVRFALTGRDRMSVPSIAGGRSIGNWKSENLFTGATRGANICASRRLQSLINNEKASIKKRALIGCSRKKGDSNESPSRRIMKKG